MSRLALGFASATGLGRKPPKSRNLSSGLGISIRDARALGVDEGYGIAEDVIFGGEEDIRDADHLMDVVGEIEENARQDYRNPTLARDLNDSRNPDAVWDAYGDGVYSGARKAWRKWNRGRRGRVV